MPDHYQVIYLTIVNVARKLGCDTADLFSAGELREWILEKDREMASLLSAFIEAYETWHKICERNFKLGKEELDSVDREEHAQAVAKRNDARHKLAQRLVEGSCSV